MSHAIECRDVTKRYPAAADATLCGLSLAVATGEFVCLVGPSGCGKSTILRLIAGLESPTGGSIVVDGVEPTSRQPALAMVFQTAALLPWRTALANVGLGLEMRGMSSDQWEPLARQALADLGLAKHADRLPRELSVGMRQRVGVARALVVEPQILLLDEPTSALDPQSTAQLHDDLLRAWGERRITIVMVSHSVDEALILSDCILVIDRGRVTKTVNVAAPRPRDSSSPEMRGLRGELTTLLEAAGGRGPEKA